MEVKKIYRVENFLANVLKCSLLLLGKVRFLLGVGRNILDTFCEKIRGPHTSQNGFIHDPSHIPTQKHLSPHLLQDKN